MTERFADEKVAYYSKTIQLSDTGIVFAEVFAHAEDGHKLRRVGFNHYSAFWLSIIQRVQRAHQYADAIIDICQKYEMQEVRQ